MRQILLLILALTIAAGCARLPAIVPDDRSGIDSARDVVGGIFPSGDWQFSHAIRATIPGGKTIEMVGVSVLSSTEGSIRCVLMTLEGIVLFSGRFDERLTVERTIPLPPFDRPGFAEGLMSDLRMLFLAPKAPMVSFGRLPSGDRIARFRTGGKTTTTDIVLRRDQAWSVNEYSRRNKLVRSVEARDVSPAGGDVENRAAHKIVLRRTGLLGYQLDMRLFEVINLNEKEKTHKN